VSFEEGLQFVLFVFEAEVMDEQPKKNGNKGSEHYVGA
jgi:hypothetical protein